MFFERHGFRRVGTDDVPAAKWAAYDPQRKALVAVFRFDLANPPMIIGIDIGGSTTDAVLLDDALHVVSVEANDPIAAAAGALGKLVSDLHHRLSDITAIAATGGGARFLGDDLLGVPVHKVTEITAIGLGGSTLAGKPEALVVSMGTGTAMVSVKGGAIRARQRHRRRRRHAARPVEASARTWRGWRRSSSWRRAATCRASI